MRRAAREDEGESRRFGIRADSMFVHPAPDDPALTRP